MLLASACLTSFRQDEALAAYERVITIEERPDALTAAGELYARAGRHADAAARFARAHAAGAGPDALLANARALSAAGDRAAAVAALALWAVPDGERAGSRGRRPTIGRAYSVDPPPPTFSSMRPKSRCSVP
jgi:tetratricopeptide (TPR) repeat protein